ncbi:hypothetical protein [Streptomyces sp. NPDC055749]
MGARRPVDRLRHGPIRRRRTDRGAGRGAGGPAAGLAEETSWVAGVVAVTGWGTARARTFDWAAVEARIGTALPTDYKQLTGILRRGAFDGFLELHLPDAGFESGDIVLHTEWLSEWARTNGSRL